MLIKDPIHRWQLAFGDEWATSVAFLSDTRIAAGNRAGQIYLWELPATEAEAPEAETPPDLPPQRRLDGHTNGITHLAALPDGRTLISASLDHAVCQWDVAGPATGEDEVILDSKGREVASRGKSKAEQEAIRNAPGAKVECVAAQHTLAGHRGWVYGLGVSGDGKRLISGDDQCLSIVWDLETRQQVSSWHGYDRVWVRAAALSPDGKTAFTSEYAGRRSSFDAPAAQVRLWNADDGTEKLNLLKIWTPDVKEDDRIDSYGYAQAWGKLLKRGLVCAAFSPDGKLLAAGQGGETDTGKIHLVDTDSGEIVRTVSGHRYGACDVAFSADGQLVASSGRDTMVRICQVSDGKEVAALGTSRGGQFKDWLHAIAISPNQNLIAAADIAGYVHVWQLN